MSQTDPPPNHAHESTHDRSPAPGNVLGLPDDSFVIAEWRDAGGPPGPPRLIAPRHLHHSDDEAWYVLEGTLCVQVGDKDVQAPAIGRARSSWNAPHLLESRSRTPSLPPHYDSQHLQPDPGNPCPEGAHSRLPSATVPRARLRAALSISPSR